MKIAVLHGAIINAGDFLIKNRAISLLKYFYPDSEIVEYYRNQSLEEKLPEINACDILVFAGGPGYCNGFYPRMAPVTDDLNKTNTEIAKTLNAACPISDGQAEFGVFFDGGQKHA